MEKEVASVTTRTFLALPSRKTSRKTSRNTVRKVFWNRQKGQWKLRGAIKAGTQIKLKLKRQKETQPTASYNLLQKEPQSFIFYSFLFKDDDPEFRETLCLAESGTVGCKGKKNHIECISVMLKFYSFWKWYSGIQLLGRLD